MLVKRKDETARFARTTAMIQILQAFLLASCAGGLARAETFSNTNGIISQPLSRAEAITLGLRQNPNILKAQKNLEASQGVVIQTRAIAIPIVRITGDYTAVAPGDVDKP